MKKIANLIQEIDAWGEKSPQLVCYDNGVEHTYKELLEKSNRLASYLLKLNLSLRPIMIIGQLSFEMLPSFLGAVKAGHGYIPIEAHTPKERLEMIYDQAKPALVIALEDFSSTKIKADLNFTDLNNIFSKEEIIPLPEVPLEQDFYIIFTSGTTGLPKGVPINQRNLLSFVNWEMKDLLAASKERFLAQAPFSFDLSVMSLYPALVSGGCLVPLEKKVTDNFKLLFEKLPTLNLNVWVSTPSFVEICLLEKNFNEKYLPQLKTFLFCGEEFPVATAKKLQAAFPTARIFNTYGPTETTVAITQVALNPTFLKGNRLPIGFLKEDTEVIIVNEFLEQVKEGESGEILISGPSVAEGYFENPAKTKEAFIQLNGKTYYRTKDQGHFSNGLLWYEGRLDLQVKLHGFRLELEDVDQNLGQVSLVKSACTVAKYKKSSNGISQVQQLVAFVVLEKNNASSEFSLTQEIKKELGEKVMEYMVPKQFIYLEALPLTPNGKVDRKSLSATVNGGS